MTDPTIGDIMKDAEDEARLLRAGGYGRQADELLEQTAARLEMQVLGLVEPEPANLYDLFSMGG